MAAKERKKDGGVKHTSCEPVELIPWPWVGRKVSTCVHWSIFAKYDKQSERR